MAAEEADEPGRADLLPLRQAFRCALEEDDRVVRRCLRRAFGAVAQRRLDERFAGWPSSQPRLVFIRVAMLTLAHLSAFGGRVATMSEVNALHGPVVLAAASVGRIGRYDISS